MIFVNKWATGIVYESQTEKIVFLYLKFKKLYVIFTYYHVICSFLKDHRILPHRISQSSKCCTLSWWEGLRALETLEAISAGTAVPGRFNLAGLVKGQTNCNTWPSRFGAKRRPVNPSL